MSSDLNPPAYVPRPAAWALWTGRIITGLVTLALAGSVGMKLAGDPAGEEMMAHQGIPSALTPILAGVEASCLLLYLIPRTAPLGAILLTGYLGGAIFTHVRVGDPFVPPLAIGVLVWIGLALRDSRLAAYLWQTFTGR